ncbi:MULTISPECIES: DUF418 domain-containing protein [Micrococcaceae]|uniref:DUF418 domain-containing protein n=1 Tax=unclassified Kocuria TaxID=2649579 RepID=UPI00101259AB|nr:MULTISPECIES: DUF418 domain-containing protein [unclassified Kocuria]
MNPGIKIDSAPVRAASQSSASGRIPELDVLRGLALAGIILVNAPQILHLGALPNETSHWLNDFVQQRFFPIFSLLFGTGFGLMWAGAREKTDSPRWAMARRFLMLAVLGVIHQVLQPGEALLPYAVAGLVFLLPSTFVPEKARTWVCLVLGTALTAVGVTVFSGGPVVIPGLFLLGFSLGGSSWVRKMTAYPKLTWGITLILVIADACGYLMTSQQARFLDSNFAAQFGLLGALTYCFVVLAIMTTPVRGFMIATFSPLGKMALTNYIGATVIVLAARFLVPGLFESEDPASWVWCLAGCGAVLIVQWLYSTAWLRAFAQGPLERLWRLVTWWGNGSSRSVPRST